MASTGPSIATGGSAPATREPSGSLASTSGLARSMRRPSRLTIRWSRWWVVASPISRPVASTRPRRSIETTPPGPPTMISVTCGSASSGSSGPSPSTARPKPLEHVGHLTRTEERVQIVHATSDLCRGRLGPAPDLVQHPIVDQRGELLAPGRHLLAHRCRCHGATGPSDRRNSRGRRATARPASTARATAGSTATSATTVASIARLTSLDRRARPGSVTTTAAERAHPQIHRPTESQVARSGDEHRLVRGVQQRHETIVIGAHQTAVHHDRTGLVTEHLDQAGQVGGWIGSPSRRKQPQRRGDLDRQPPQRGAVGRGGTEPVIQTRSVGFGHAEGQRRVSGEIDEQRSIPVRRQDGQRGGDGRGADTTLGAPTGDQHGVLPRETSAGTERNPGAIGVPWARCGGGAKATTPTHRPPYEWVGPPTTLCSPWAREFSWWGPIEARVRRTPKAMREKSAEVDGNRTRRAGITRPTRFEGGGAHQALGHLHDPP